MANTYTGSDVGKAGLNVKKTDDSVDVNGVTEIQLDSNLTLTPNGGGSVTIQSSGGGGGDTYTLQADAKSGSSVPLKLDANTGTDSTVNLTEGSNITLTRNSATQITIESTGGGTPGGTNGQIQFNDNGSFGGVTSVPIANGGTNATDSATALANLGAAASGANSDITSLSGLTTPLSIAQGGTDATDAATALANLGGLPTIATIVPKDNTNDGETVDPSLTGAVIICDTSTAGFTLELGAGDPDGTQFVFINSGPNPLILEVIGGNINGAGTYPLNAQYQAATVIKQGVTWFAIG